MDAFLLLLAGLATTAVACPSPTTTAFSSHTYTVKTSTRYATPLPSPLALTTTYAPAFTDASKLLPSNVTYTSYTLVPNATLTGDGQYGQSAYANLWANITYNQTIPFTTTASPTPVASSELVFPPELYYTAEAKALPDCYKLPKDFLWGVAGSAFQIEGGLKYDGRGPAQLDVIGALPNTGDQANAEITNMNYFLYKQDIARLAAIGMPYYSFSISWTRIVPFGVADSPINVPGLEHYDDLINTCIEYGITPIVTLQHADPPLYVPMNDTRYPDAFLYYAKQVMTRYGDRVKYWVTLNEPNIAFPTTPYSAITNILTAHAKVYHWYKETLEGTGQITIKFANNLALPLDGDNPADHAAVQRYQDFILGGMANPIFLGKQYPASFLSTPNLNITPLTSSQISYFNGTADFWSFDPYTAQFASSLPNSSACISNSSDPLYPTCVELTNVQSDGWLMGQASYAYAYLAPQYVRQQLGYVWNTFKPRGGILIAEFGFNPFMEFAKTEVAQRYDLERSLYYFGFLREMMRSIYEDGAKIIGALAWSFADNDEFVSFLQQ